MKKYFGYVALFTFGLICGVTALSYSSVFTKRNNNGLELFEGIGEPINLANYYNSTLSDGRGTHKRERYPNNLASMPNGRVNLGGVKFDVYGVMQVGPGTDYDDHINIVVLRKAKYIHLLHGTGGFVDENTQIAKIELIYKDGDSYEVPILYGVHIRDWWMWNSKEVPITEPYTYVAWEGENQYSREKKCYIRIYLSIICNPKPDKIIESITYSYEDNSRKTSPFIIAISTSDELPRQEQKNAR